MKTIVASPASPGAGIAISVVVRAPVPLPRRVIQVADVGEERDRFGEAVAEAVQELETLAAEVGQAGHEDEAAIFSAHASMARDPALAARVDTLIGEQIVDASTAVMVAAEEIADQLRSLDSEALAARAADLLDVGERIARRAAGLPDAELPKLDAPAIIVAEDLPPSVTARLDRTRVAGFVLEQGSATSHVAILARAYGIPAVVGAEGLIAEMGKIPSEIAIDGTRGLVFIDPDNVTRALIGETMERRLQERETAYAESSLQSITLDGTTILLLANIGAPDEATEAVALGAEGVGLFRTEFLFSERVQAPSQAEQAEAYRSVVEAFAPHPVIIRLLDVGGDKPLPYLGLPHEDNPFLGVRALRIARRHPSLFINQLRATMIAALAGSVKVMAPMVADAEDVALFQELATRAKTELDDAGIPNGPIRLGVMLEIPASILVADTFFPALGFASLGTNDLLQYTTAADRGNPRLAPYQDPLHPALLRMIAMAVDAAERSRIELSVCGEMAGDPVAVRILVGLGIRRISMTPGSLAAVRRVIRTSNLADLERVASEGLTKASAAEVRALLEPLS